MAGLVRRCLLAVAAMVLAVLGMVTYLWSRTSERVCEISFSTATATGSVGADWARRRGYAGDPVVGETEDFAVFDREDFDTSAVHPEIRRFYERTAEYEMGYTVRWHRGFRPGAWLASFLTTWLGQLNLPGRSTDTVRYLESELVAVPEAVDPRGSVVWTRTDPDGGQAVFVAIYASHEHDGVTYANVAVPLPGSNLSTVLRPWAIEVADEAGSDNIVEDDGVVFTTDGPGDGGLYLVTPLGPLGLPMRQSFRIWLADADGAPASPVEGADLIATHEMWLCGRQFLTITYGITRTGENESIAE